MVVWFRSLFHNLWLQVQSSSIVLGQQWLLNKKQILREHLLRRIPWLSLLEQNGEDIDIHCWLDLNKERRKTKGWKPEGQLVIKTFAHITSYVTNAGIDKKMGVWALNKLMPARRGKDWFRVQIYLFPRVDTTPHLMSMQAPVGKVAAPV